MNIQRYRKVLESSYADTATIIRVIEVEKPSGETVQKFDPVYSDQPCRLSQKVLAVNDQTEAQNNITYLTKLFIAPELTILQGYEVTVKHVGRELSFVAGEPYLYPTHQEVILQRKGLA
ncbi:ABC transporter ATP-binding protein [Paenibacillus sp. GbtcB18]|uniref:ABC transporter ATP-binding protein n=1 Tax=Paenibacillus sp. GbtcB18 TaxID=2824763 RepID=UPI001C2FC195|nr:ABC transporter ATP-binding protein [Paenibacillus sp. GbtcB18]